MTKIEVVNPYTLENIGSVDLVDWEKVDRYLDDAKKLHEDQSAWLPKHERIDILRKTADMMEKDFDMLALQIANEGGKPLKDARVEVTRAIDGVRLCISELGHLKGTEIPMDLTKAGSGHIAFTMREPIGPVVAISAFNHPLNLIIHQVAPAVAVGCPVLVKPAGTTPLSCQYFVGALHKAGLDPKWCRFVPCKTDVAEKMATDPRTKFLSFIGSAKIGWMLKSKLAPGTRCAMEHGGVAPVIIDNNVDLDAIIPSLGKGGLYHSGQVCVSVQKVFAPTAIAEKLAKKLGDYAEKLVVGNAIDEVTDCGPLITPNEVDRVEKWVNEALQMGAKLIAGGKRLGDTTYAPTILLDPPQNATLSKSEIFGPVIAIYSCASIDEAIKEANSLDFAFQASIFTNRLDKAMHTIQHLDATAVMVNDHTAFRVDWMPFAGRRHSGYGTGGIGYTMHDMTHDKMAVIKL